MPLKLIPSFLFYCFVSGITPGPANLCSLSAALKYGREAALRQWRGLFTGFFVIAVGSVFVTYFLGNVMGDHVRWLSYIGAAYIIYLALHILRSPEAEERLENSSCNFLTGLLVQLTNVKVMIFCLTALTSYVLPYAHSFWSLFLVGCILPFTGPICNLAWLFAGVSLRQMFERHRKLLNIVMALSLFACALSIVRSA